MELPTVATRIPGCVDAIEDGVTGMLAPARDFAALATALRRYIDDPELRSEEMRQALYAKYGRLVAEVS